MARIVESAVGRRLHAKQVLSVLMIAYGIIWADRLGVAAVGTAMARRAFGKIPKHGIKQVNRCLSDGKLRLSTLFSGYVPFVVGQRQSIVVTRDQNIGWQPSGGHLSLRWSHMSSVNF